MLSEPKRMNARLNRNDTSCVLEGPCNINFIIISSVQTSVYTSNFFGVTRNPVSEYIQALRVETSHTHTVWHAPLFSCGREGPTHGINHESSCEFGDRTGDDFFSFLF